MKSLSDKFTALASLFIFFTFMGCTQEIPPGENAGKPSFRTTKNIEYNGVSVALILDIPEGEELDILVVFHGTVYFDSLILQAANSTLDKFKDLLVDRNMAILSVAYPEENLLFGDNIQHCEAALLWIKNELYSAIGVRPLKIFLAGHSQGGYLATRLNRLHPTDGVIANGPGPLDLLLRCRMEENGQAPQSPQCSLLKNHFGTTEENPMAYRERSLLYFTEGFKADILFVQGLMDSPIQLYSWGPFKEKVVQCTSCQQIQFYEVKDLGHGALFQSPAARKEFNSFINSR